MKGRAESSECVMIRICALMNRHRLSKKQDAHGLRTPKLHFFKIRARSASECHGRPMHVLIKPYIRARGPRVSEPRVLGALYMAAKPRGKEADSRCM